MKSMHHRGSCVSDASTSWLGCLTSGHVHSLLSGLGGGSKHPCLLQATLASGPDSGVPGTLRQAGVVLLNMPACVTRPRTSIEPEKVKDEIVWPAAVFSDGSCCLDLRV